MGVVNRMVRNTASLSAARMVSLACSMIFSIFAARSLGELHYGMYAFVMVLTSYFIVTSEYGLDNLIVRDIADSRERSDDYLTSTIAIKALTSSVSVALMLLALVLMRRGDVLDVAVWAGMTIIPSVFYMSIDAIFRGHEKMHYITIVETVYSVLRAALGIVVVLGTRNLITLFQTFFFVEIFRLVLAVIIYNSAIGRLRFQLNLGLSRKLFTSGFSMAYWRLLGALFGQVDILILAVMLGDRTVGWFKVSRNITDMISTGSMIIINVLMPVMTIIHSRSQETFRKAYTIIFKYILVGMLPVTVIIWAYSEKIVLLLYGGQYTNSITILRYLIWTSLIDFLLALIGTTMIIINRFKTAARVSILTVTLRIALCAILIDRFGYIGACYGAIAIGIISLTIHIPILYRSIGNTGLEEYGVRLVAILGAFILFYGIIMNVAIVGNEVLVPIVILFYIMVLVKFNVITQKDIDYFRYEA